MIGGFMSVSMKGFCFYWLLRFSQNAVFIDSIIE